MAQNVVWSYINHQYHISNTSTLLVGISNSLCIVSQIKIDVYILSDGIVFTGCIGAVGQSCAEMPWSEHEVSS